MQITIAGENPKFCKQLEQLLTAQDHRVTVVPWSPRLAQAVDKQAPHLLVLVPPHSQEALVAALRELRKDQRLLGMPILCVNPKSGVSDGVAALDSGADDFINRPFNPDIFTARVRTLLRRRIWSGELQEEEVTAVECGPIALRLVSRQANLSGKALTLTRLEFDLLAYLVRNADRVFKREELLEAVWNYPQSVETRTLDKHVETLRRKLGDFGASIQTVHGVGYRLVPPASKKR